MIGHREDLCVRRAEKEKPHFMIFILLVYLQYPASYGAYTGAHTYTYTYGTRLCLSLCVSGVRPVVYF